MVIIATRSVRGRATYTIIMRDSNVEHGVGGNEEIVVEVHVLPKSRRPGILPVVIKANGNENLVLVPFVLIAYAIGAIEGRVNKRDSW